MYRCDIINDELKIMKQLQINLANQFLSISDLDEKISICKEMSNITPLCDLDEKISICKEMSNITPSLPYVSLSSQVDI